MAATDGLPKRLRAEICLYAAELGDDMSAVDVLRASGVTV